MDEFVLIASAMLFGYALGSIPFAWIFARLKGVDLRKFGSGNIGATNAGRAMGLKWFFIIFVLDAGKGLAAVLLAMALRRWQIAEEIDFGMVNDFSFDVDGHEVMLRVFSNADVGLWAGLGAILGHVFPVWLKFRGGKAVATGVGVLFALSWMTGVAALATFLFVVAVSRYVSLGSILGAIVAPAAFGAMNIFSPYNEKDLVTSRLIFFSIMALFIVIRHLSNIKRLLRGEEHKVGSKRSVPPPIPHEAAP